MTILDYILITLFVIFLSLQSIIIKSGSNDNRQDKSSFLLIKIVHYLCPLIGIIIAISKVGNISGAGLFHYFGVIFVLAGIIIRLIAILTLKRQFTYQVTIIENHQMIDSGIYRYIRHPAYLGSLLAFLGLAMYFGNWISFLVIFIPVFSVYYYRMIIEECVLMAQFGPKYLVYKQKTARLIPKIF